MGSGPGIHSTIVLPYFHPPLPPPLSFSLFLSLSLNAWCCVYMCSCWWPFSIRIQLLISSASLENPIIHIYIYIYTVQVYSYVFYVSYLTRLLYEFLDCNQFAINAFTAYKVTFSFSYSCIHLFYIFCYILYIICIFFLYKCFILPFIKLILQLIGVFKLATMNECSNTFKVT